VDRTNAHPALVDLYLRDQTIERTSPFPNSIELEMRGVMKRGVVEQATLVSCRSVRASQLF
jgi:hypothetical protein